MHAILFYIWISLRLEIYDNQIWPRLLCKIFKRNVQRAKNKQSFGARQQ